VVVSNPVSGGIYYLWFEVHRVYIESKVVNIFDEYLGSHIGCSGDK